MRSFYRLYKIVVVFVFSLMLINPVFAIDGVLPGIQDEQLKVESSSNMTMDDYEMYGQREQEDLHVYDKNEEQKKKFSFMEKISSSVKSGINLINSGVGFMLGTFGGPLFLAGGAECKVPSENNKDKSSKPLAQPNRQTQKRNPGSSGTAAQKQGRPVGRGRTVARRGQPRRRRNGRGTTVRRSQFVQGMPVTQKGTFTQSDSFGDGYRQSLENNEDKLKKQSDVKPVKPSFFKRIKNKFSRYNSEGPSVRERKLEARCSELQNKLLKEEKKVEELRKFFENFARVQERKREAAKRRVEKDRAFINRFNFRNLNPLPGRGGNLECGLNGNWKRKGNNLVGKTHITYKDKDGNSVTLTGEGVFNTKTGEKDVNIGITLNKSFASKEKSKEKKK
jgi:hypothetical protein